MAGLSVNTNAGALTALQSLAASERGLAAIRNRVSTGLKISSAKDDGGIYAIAQSMRADAAGYRAALNSIDRATGAVETALAATQAISDALIEMKRIVLAASDTSLDLASVQALGANFFALADLAYQMYTEAEFAGVNLIDAGQADLSVLIGPDPGDVITISAEDLSDNGGNVDFTVGGQAPYGPITFATHTDASKVAGVRDNLANVNAAAARLGASLRRLEIQRKLSANSMDQINIGIGNLVDADMAKDVMLLKAGEVRRDLGVQALSIANATPNLILSLFR